MFGMSAPRAGRGLKPFQACPSESFSLSTVLWACGRASGVGPSSCAHHTTRCRCYGELHHLLFCPHSRHPLLDHVSLLTLSVPEWQLGLAILEVFFFAPVQLAKVLEESKVPSLHHQKLSNTFHSKIFFDAGCTRSWSSQSSVTTIWSSCEEGPSFSSRCMSCVWFRSDMEKVACLIG